MVRFAGNSYIECALLARSACWAWEGATNPLETLCSLLAAQRLNKLTFPRTPRDSVETERRIGLIVFGKGKEEVGLLFIIGTTSWALDTTAFRLTSALSPLPG